MKNLLSDDIYLKRTRKRTPDIRGDYFRDQTAIIHSTPFRRLKHKTQVFHSPSNDHVCTRIEHVMHVATVAATICRGLNHKGWELDTDLAFAIGLGHDLGHAPFGHSGEDAINNILKGKDVFMHEVNSYRVAQHLANNGKGLNLTYAVKDGIISHNGEKYEQSLKPVFIENDLEKIKGRNVLPSSYEGCIVRLSDKISYLGRDIEDALVMRLIKPKDIPVTVLSELGESNGEIIETLVSDLIEYSYGKDVVGFSDEKYRMMVELKDFNYNFIYKHPKILRYQVFCNRIIVLLFEYLMELYGSYGRDYGQYGKNALPLDRAFGNYINEMQDFYTGIENDPYRIVTDYVAGMTDIYALDSAKQITLPEPIDSDIY